MSKINNWKKFFHKMIQNLLKKVRLDVVILFGSYARSENTRYSDFDLVIVGDFKGNFLERSAWIMKNAPLLPLDLFCYTKKEFEEMFSTFHLTAIDAIGEGIELFGDEFFNSYKERYNYFITKGMKKTKCVLIPPSL